MRSSATLEDGAEHSFAGQFATRLHVARPQLASAVDEVAASAFSERVGSYLSAHGLPGEELRMYVVVQEMVAVRVSGVAFGADPVSGLLDVAVVAAVFGLGEGLVDGTLDADRTLVHRDGRLLQRTIARQERQLVARHSSEGGTIWQGLDAQLVDAPKLSDEECRAIASTAWRLALERGGPQDVEFALDVQRNVWLLQSRPITTLREELRIYDNSNIVESYPGLTLPYTFAFIERAYAEVYRQLCSVLGVRRARIDAHPVAYESLLACLAGRVYYNLNSWYAVLSLLPGYRLNARAMERMMGVAEPLDLPPLAQPSRLRAGLDTAAGLFGLVRAFRQLPRSRALFRQDFESIVHEYKRLDYHALAPDVLRDVHDRFETTLTERWRAPLVNDFFAMIAFSALGGLARRWDVPRPDSITNELLAGAGEVISTQPVERTLGLSARIIEQPAAEELFTDSNLSDEDLWDRLRTDPELADLRAGIEGYIADWGARTIGELKLETETYEQNPIAYLNLLRAYVRRGLMPKSTGGVDPASTIRAAAEAEVARHLGYWRRRLFFWVLRHTRTLVAERENLRYERTRGFAEVRRMALARGRQLSRAGRLDRAGDIFYLTRDESEAGGTDLRETIAERRADYARYAVAELPERIRLRGSREQAAIEIFANSASASSERVLPQGATSATQLVGTACCAGTVEAEARVVTDPTDTDNLAGGILVTRSTDPGWVTLFPTASAIAVERGSLLSHAAIVSREMGIPCVVGVSGLLAAVRTGDRLRLDGTTGVIELLSPIKDPAP